MPNDGPAMTRLSFDLDASLAADFGEMAKETGIDVAEILRSGLSVMKAFRDQRTFGRKHLGFASNPARLDAEIVGLLQKTER
ncbi:hypothetical protein [Rhizobium leguminosarum]|uniref:hypothetical protein n=1 Tax=Rhizobium leguminosarum TaxID=384 RepID=UPI002E13845D|nr:hypothetical protein U8Q02_41635 [Rhizobium leguminosarum]